ncbi:PREDICTED: N-acetyllactosaminide beta-1,3-N-acetylglucosaminyltransferase 3 [Mandrillus leucophaeus]|uniref:Hexosyltransferase n=1 Tax=Mandrillus leucophaeus TaxID=9568 RepID=A0A2K5YKY8_MANLE|nr:PREDICTED: N-acetyllactosaminide beta-1,3-N-acetylglucosaminyltransferase 3 [Mandrillus leucophaeus]XP_011845492.1 PREDICTED: N-acetyllactosaminide beta-1,3-N-acetylglucosaminyltransferase 3 [Mandrillus leucophaeus]XP_011845499.1 PREDICTED: N-acetyllactosaminide beta-1,3-N-acetylglucosaminyltransferase 3 [Mandrillus leucophaeus]XP_011845508.1 PREDICTED: N-acetyllactosaminide beta-1,3-N-acetylglucosaminyltransferase 3 [Mandrillus leucophaeus]
MRYLRHLRPNATLILAIVAFTLLLLFSLQLSPPTRKVQEQPPATPEALAWPTPPTHPARAPCQANTSMANHPDFAKQPKNVRDFLLYKHCRDFPLLQDVPPSKCAQPVFLLLVIKSSPTNYERRELLRRTWGRERKVRGLQLRLLFLVGTASSPHQARKVNRLLQLEAQAHGDILQWDFHDSFFNLTLKQVLFLQWQETRCANASFVLNGDDDVFAHTDNMVFYLQGHDPGRHLFVGQLIQNVGPIRALWSKYYVPKVVTQNERYPPYCAGGGFLLSRFTAAAVRRAALVLDLFPIDDVFLGMCLELEGLKPTSHSGIRTSGVRAPSQRLSSFDPCFYRDLLLVHRFLPYEMLLMWDALNQPNLTCSKQTRIY